MYSEKITQRQLDAFEKKEGWRPQQHTIAEVDEFKEYINSITNIESNSRNTYISLKKFITAKQQDEIKRFVLNEQVMCAVDSTYFDSRYAYVQDGTGKIVRFKNWKSQEILDRIFADHEEKGIPTELLMLQTRQAGLGTKIMLKGLHRALFSPNSTILIYSPIKIKMERVSIFCDLVHRRCPWWLVPMKKQKRTFSNDAYISFSCSSLGWIPQFTYIPNIELIQNPSRDIEEGLLRIGHSSKSTSLVIAGKLTGKEDWFTNVWSSARENWEKGKSRLRPIFVPWAMCSDMYPTPDWINKFPTPRKWSPSKKTLEHAIRCEKYVRATPYLSSIVGKRWKMPIEQQWYWEHGYKHAERLRALDSWLDQMRPDDEPQAKPIIADDLDVPIDEIELDNVFPTPTEMQKKVAAIAAR